MAEPDGIRLFIPTQQEIRRFFPIAIRSHTGDIELLTQEFGLKFVIFGTRSQTDANDLFHGVLLLCLLDDRLGRPAIPFFRIANGNRVYRTDVHGLGTKAFLCFVFRLFVDIVITLFMIGTKVMRCDCGADGAADTAFIHTVFSGNIGWKDPHGAHPFSSLDRLSNRGLRTGGLGGGNGGDHPIDSLRSAQHNRWD